MKPPHLKLVPPPAKESVGEPPAPLPWWEAPEFLALSEVRAAITMGEVPSQPPETPEESARAAVFWLLYEGEHIVREFVHRLQSGEKVFLRSGIYAHQVGRVDFNLRIVEHVEIVGPGGGR